jgi:AcrR family transcriptional regulator
MSDSSYGQWPLVPNWREMAREHLASSSFPDEGLRERKKRLMRQQISDTATGMFLERGFDEVKITEVADACGVSEKTIYNYFPTKESLLLDREEEMADDIRRVLGLGGPKISPVEATVEILEVQLNELFAHWDSTDNKDVSMLRRFVELIESTPALRAAHFDMMDRYVQVAAKAMAERAGVDPQDPEPQIAAIAIVGLWRIYFRSVVKYSHENATPAEVRDAVMKEVRRAARLIDTGVWSFGLAVQGATGREQLRVAGDASNEARRQVVLAIKQAKTAFRQMKHELKDQIHDERDFHREQWSTADAQVKRVVHQAQRDAQEVKLAAQRIKREAQRARQDLRQELRRSARPGPDRKKR